MSRYLLSISYVILEILCKWNTDWMDRVVRWGPVSTPDQVAVHSTRGDPSQQWYNCPAWHQLRHFSWKHTFPGRNPVWRTDIADCSLLKYSNINQIRNGKFTEFKRNFFNYFFNFQFYYSRWQWMSIKWVSYDARRSCKDINPGGDIYN